MGLEVLEQQVRRDLEENVRNEENDERRVELVVLQTQLDGHVEDVGIGDVDAICSRHLSVSNDNSTTEE